MKPSSHTVRFVTLGCPKNQVDSEVLMGQLEKDHFLLANPDSPSDVGIVNTCGFIEASKQESINTILELAKEKKKGRLKVLLVAGCLSQRYKEELPDLIPEVDAFVGTADFSRVSEIITQKLDGQEMRDYVRHPSELMTWSSPRLYTTPPYMRYVKISEGCSHTCSFCTIPLMRGNLLSRKLDDVILEIKNGVENGVKEFNLIAQDLNEYGRDLKERQSLYNLFDEIGKIEGNFWVRPLYMYPLQFPDKLIRLMKNHPHIIPYVDIPLQHIDDRILKSMNRGSSAKYIHRLVDQLKTSIPGIALRTTFIVGYPGETDDEFEKLADFVEKSEFDNVGVFTFSQEESTPSATLPGQLPKKVKEERRARLMALQQKISKKKNQTHVGKTYDVLIEGNEKRKGKDFLTGRFYGQAPDIDGKVFITYPDNETIFMGDFSKVKITKGMEYD